MKEVNILEKGKKFQEIETNYFQNLITCKIRDVNKLSDVNNYWLNVGTKYPCLYSIGYRQIRYLKLIYAQRNEISDIKTIQYSK